MTVSITPYPDCMSFQQTCRNCPPKSVFCVFFPSHLSVITILQFVIS